MPVLEAPVTQSRIMNNFESASKSPIIANNTSWNPCLCINSSNA
jgi:hypothetical protein